jgi:hypothetical protein
MELVGFPFLFSLSVFVGVLIHHAVMAFALKKNGQNWRIAK